MAVLAAIGLATTAISSLGSFAQANKFRKDKQNAEDAAKKAFKEAEKRTKLNVYDALTISDTPYERQREMFNAQTQQMMTGFQELGVQGMRGAAAALALGSKQQQDVRDTKTQRLEAVEKFKLDEEGRLKDLGMSLKLKEAEGAQQAALDAQQAQNAAITQGLSGISSIGEQMLSVNPVTGESFFELYGKDKTGTGAPKAPTPKSTSAGAGFGDGMLSPAALQALSTLSNQQPIVNPTYQTPNLQEALQQQGMTQRYYGDEQF